MTNWHTSETVQRVGLLAVQGLVPEFKSTVEGTNTQKLSSDLYLHTTTHSCSSAYVCMADRQTHLIHINILDRSDQNVVYKLYYNLIRYIEPVICVWSNVLYLFSDCHSFWIKMKQNTATHTHISFMHLSSCSHNALNSFKKGQISKYNQPTASFSKIWEVLCVHLQSRAHHRSSVPGQFSVTAGPWCQARMHLAHGLHC